MSKRILSIDQAANVSGWSYWENDKPVKWGTISPTPASAKEGRRLASLREKFGKLIDEVNPNFILIENPVGGEEDKTSGPENNWKTMQTLCQVQGVLMELIYEKNIPMEIISPSSWQFTCGIHKRWRAERKAGARAFVEKKYGLTETDIVQDIVDSICIAHHYIETSKPERSAF